MLLQRNLLTSIYSFVFTILMGLGFFQVSYLALIHAPNRNAIGCVLVIGLILYLILAFFIRSKKILCFFQKNSKTYWIIELLLFLVLCSGLVYFNTTQSIMDSILILAMLLCIYVSSRLLGGRICGVISLVTGFFFLLNVALAFYNQEQYINILCFLIPYMCFLIFTKIIGKRFASDGFILFMYYAFLAFVFSLAIEINPLVCFLLAGCILSLIFAKPEKKGCSLLSGPISGGIIVLFVAVILVIFNLFLFQALSLFNDTLDSNFVSASSFETFRDYILGKYMNTNFSVFQIFDFWLFPAILLFFGMLTGFFGMTKKSSGIGPLCLSFIGTWIYYMLFSENGSHFYYLTYFLPIFASYGIYNTLLPMPKEEKASPEQTLQNQTLQDQIPTVEESVVKNDGKENTEQQEIKRKKEKEENEIMKNEKEIPVWTIPKEYEINHEEIKEKETKEHNSDTISVEQYSDMQLIEPASIQTITNDGENDLEQFVEEDGTLDTSEIEKKESAEDNQLNILLDRLDITDNIRRMNEIAMEDIADVIEKEDIFDEEITEVPTDIDVDVLEDSNGNLYTEDNSMPVSHSTLPKYVKPDFDFKIEPVNQPLDDSYSQISEYDKVPTIRDIEDQWMEKSVDTTLEAISEDDNMLEPNSKANDTSIDYCNESNTGFAYSLDDLSDNQTLKVHDSEQNEGMETELLQSEIHSEEIVKKNEVGKRSYHRITIR